MNEIDPRWPLLTVDVELTNICGQNCLFCPREAITRPQGFMAYALFEKLIRQLAAAGSRVIFCGMGNPLLHPDIAEIGSLCRSLPLNYGLTVQAPALDAVGLEKIARLQPAFIEVSFPVVDENEFAVIFPGQKMADSLSGLHNLVGQRGSNRGITINAVMTAGSKVSDTRIKEFWAGHGLPCRVHPCHSRGGNLEKAELLLSKPRPVKACGLFATHSFISWEGNLLACCHDLENSTIVSNLNSTLLLEAAARKVAILQSGSMPFKICQSCDEPAAGRPIPDRPFPASIKARSRFLKKLNC